MHALISHFIATAPCAWLLLEYDWTATKQARPFLPHCSDIVMVGRLRWIEARRSPGSITSRGCASPPIIAPVPSCMPRP